MGEQALSLRRLPECSRRCWVSIDVRWTSGRPNLANADAAAHTVRLGPSLRRGEIGARDERANLASAKAQVEMRRAVRFSLAARWVDPANATRSAQPTCCIRVPPPSACWRSFGRRPCFPEHASSRSPGRSIGISSRPIPSRSSSALPSDRRLGRSAHQGKVVRMDPAGFLKVSALGIEEQRVRVTIDFADRPEAWPPLGHDYRSCP